MKYDGVTHRRKVREQRDKLPPERLGLLRRLLFEVLRAGLILFIALRRAAKLTESSTLRVPPPKSSSIIVALAEIE